MAKRYGPGDKVFAKVRGYPPWPARVEGVADETPNKMKYHILFYGTRETAICKSEELFSYVENREKFGKPMKKRGFNEGIAELESELGLTPKTNLQQTPGSTPGDTSYDSDTNDGNLVIDETPQGNSLQKKTKPIDATPTGTKQLSKGIKRKLESEKSSDEPEIKIKGPTISVGRKSTPNVNNLKDPEVTSRSGRKIKPKKFADESLNDESSNQGQDNTTVPAAKVATVSLKLATQGTPKSGIRDSDGSDGNKSKDTFDNVDDSFNLNDIPSIIAMTPGGQEVKIELDTERPPSFKTEKAKLQWQSDLLKRAQELKTKIESGQVIPSTVKREIEEKHHARQKMIDEVNKTCAGETQDVKLDYLRVEAQLLDIDVNIKSSLNLILAEPDNCLRILDELLDLQITPLMLKKHPECVETVKKLRKYVGNTKRWNMSERELDLFNYKASLIRAKAEHIYNKFKTLFSVPEGKSFRDAFLEELVEFSNRTKTMSVDELFALRKDPTEGLKKPEEKRKSEETVVDVNPEETSG